MYRIGQEEIDAVARVINSRGLFKTLGKGREVFHFEDELCEKVGSTHALLLTSGKAALISAMVGMGIGPGDEVIVPGYTFLATAIAVTAVGAIPVIAEVDETLCLDPEDVEKKISEHTKAIIPVHMVGMPCNLDALCAIAKKHGIFILEDACQALGATYHGKAVGTIGDAGAYSFNYYKILTAGEGGALVTNNKQIYQRAYIHHDSSAIAFFGGQMDAIDEELFCGTEFRANEITGAILREQLKRLDGMVSDLHRVKAMLTEELTGKVDFVPSNDPEGSAGMILPVRLDSEEKALAVAEAVNGSVPFYTGKHVYPNWTAIMNKRGAFHPAMDPFKMEANRGIVPDYRPDMCPKTLEILKHAAYIPLNPDMTEEDVFAIAKACLNAI